MSISIESVKAHTTSVSHVRLSGTPDLEATLVDRRFQPDQVSITYTYRQTLSGPDGWTTSGWYATSVTVSGLRVLKPSADGAQRLGKDTHKAIWSVYGGGDVQDDTRNPLPKWLDQLIDQLRPSGSLYLADAR